MTSLRPYLLRAYHEWMLDNELTPLIMIDGLLAGLKVPASFLDKGNLTLNISQSAVRNLVIDNDYLSCGARFGGSPYQLHVPLESIQAIYARENGAGFVFSELKERQGEPASDEQKVSADDDSDGSGKPICDDPSDNKKGDRSHLKIIK